MANEDYRPPIPAELRRRVLVEAGHRCAIHTCRYTDVDVHHIEPWSQCREHRFENLIALCPNCHRRADLGEIDRKSLRMYKARLAAAFRFEESQVYPDEIPAAPSFGWLDPRGRWSTSVERDSDQERRFEAQMEYPKFSFFGADLELLNDAVLTIVRRTLSRFREEVVYAPDANRYRSTLGYEISSSFAVSLLREDLVSIRFTFHAYAGGAHGSTWTEPVNAYLAPFTPISLESLVDHSLLGIEALSRYCIWTLLNPSMQTYPHDADWVRRGAGPEAENFRRFNLNEHGVLITFDEYQIDCYAAGSSEVLVPFSVLGDTLSERLRTIAVPD